jgi:hypothetical protein
LEAYDSLIADLGLQAPADKEKAAGIILRLALGQTDLDAVKLGEGAASSMLNECAVERRS